MTARLWLRVAVLVVLATGLASMVVDAVVGDDWPGWDEGWAVLAFPLGIPLPVAAGLAASSRASQSERVLVVTAAVWSWGALLFAAWLALG
jgi:hypothetical protein